MKNELGLSRKKMQKLIKKVEAITELGQLLSVEVKNQPPQVHTFYKVQGRVIEKEWIKDYKPEEIVEETVEFFEKDRKLGVSETEFKEILDIRFRDRRVQSNDISKRTIAIQDFIEDLERARIKYQKEAKRQKKELDIELVDSCERFVLFLRRIKVGRSKVLHAPYDPNLWGKPTYELFKYLFDNYYDHDKRTKRKLSNIWFYLKGLENDYPFFMTKKQYKVFILSNYEVEIKNFDKAQKFEDVDYPKMNDHRIDHSDGIKWQNT